MLSIINTPEEIRARRKTDMFMTCCRNQVAKNSHVNLLFNVHDAYVTAHSNGLICPPTKLRAYSGKSAQRWERQAVEDRPTQKVNAKYVYESEHVEFNVFNVCSQFIARCCNQRLAAV